MRVQYKLSAIRQLEKFPPPLQKRISDKIDFYAAQKEPITFAKRLSGHQAYRFRIGRIAPFSMLREMYCKYCLS